MRVFAVLAKSFPVVAGGNDEGRVEEGASLQPVKQAADLRVRLSDFAIVGNALRLGTPFGRRIVRRVRIVEVHPEEERTLRV